MIEIKHWPTGDVLHRVEADTLVGVDLRGVDLIDADLSGANLSGANLSYINLSGADLSGADLSGADLPGADLRVADLIKTILTGANLNEANLTGANLTGANLTGANLSRADLNGVNLNRVNLTRTDLSWARLYRTAFTECPNLHSALSLETVSHSGPSILDVETIRACVEHLPLIFLRGVGLTDEEIRDFRDLYAANPIQFYSCFISYSHQDKSFARRLHDQLQGRGIRCWLDEHQMLPGDDMFEMVDRAIRQWDKVLLCASQHSLTSWWVDAEINRAFKKEQRLMKSRAGQKALALIPLNLDGYLFSEKWESGIAEDVRGRLAADFTGWESDNAKFEEQFERLVNAMRADAKAREAPPAPRLKTGQGTGRIR